MIAPNWLEGVVNARLVWNGAMKPIAPMTVALATGAPRSRRSDTLITPSYAVPRPARLSGDVTSARACGAVIWMSGVAALAQSGLEGYDAA